MPQPTLVDRRKAILNRLPPKVLEALAKFDNPLKDVVVYDETLSAILTALTDEERKVVAGVLEELGQLPTAESVPAEADLRDCTLASAVLLPTDLVAAPPTPYFYEGLNTAGSPFEAPAGESYRNSVVFPVWYATTRKPVQEGKPERGFTGQSEDDGKTVHHGIARVFIPESHEPGSLGTDWLKRWLWTWQDDRLVLRQIEGKDERAFWAEMNAQLDLFSNDNGEGSKGKQILLFVHGYNVDFPYAVVRAAQLGYDLAFPGVTACFSWPSRGTYRDYVVDEAACEPSAYALADFIRNLKAAAGPSRLHILAHSMGNRVVLRALELIALKDATLAEVARTKIGHLLLAAADVPRLQFLLMMPDCLRATAGLTTMYVSRKDRALWTSRWFHDDERAGFHPRLTIVKGIHTIDVTRADLSLIGHGAYGDARPVIKDITTILHFGADPSDPRRNYLMLAGGGRYWELG